MKIKIREKLDKIVHNILFPVVAKKVEKGLYNLSIKPRFGELSFILQDLYIKLTGGK